MDFLFDDDIVFMLILLFIIFMLPQKSCTDTEDKKHTCEKTKDIIYRSKRRKEKMEKRKGLCAD